ncbi:hypothetical protein MYSTI_02196 [Myxococcus stipitatus DSM 14675]|uniref:Uncharacterized protein n=1 Tax=Myxococcus stipitatus (strain DSM 14675 / JCM 12634 / Mx s8) TaxID=1278073 RepID=L7U5Z3_MYXSD|nr:hypothetical protein [Myxococcus stipitatus]AGC43523.1 hypothetical protein MYSTI_02196 [Myxococcus stipitatus DSM 14675]
MSMHEIEDLVEGSVRVLHRRAAPDDPAPRSQFALLFDFQGRFDCSFTHFRVMDILLARRFTYQFDVADHPDHAARRTFFQGIQKFTYLHEPLEAEAGDDDAEPAPVAGYIEPPHLYCDAGSALWRRMVETGKLKGPDTEPPAPLLLADVAHEVMLAAEAEGDLELIAMWFNLGPLTLFGDRFTRRIRKGDIVGKNPFTGADVVAEADFVARGRFTLEELQATPRATQLRDLVRRTRALSAELAYDSRPPAEFLEQSPPAAWWWEGL